MPAPNSRHTGGVNMLWVDGRVTFVSENINRAVYAASLTWNGMSDGELLGGATGGGGGWRTKPNTPPRQIGWGRCEVKNPNGVPLAATRFRHHLIGNAAVAFRD